MGTIRTVSNGKQISVLEYDDNGLSAFLFRGREDLVRQACVAARVEGLTVTITEPLQRLLCVSCNSKTLQITSVSGNGDVVDCTKEVLSLLV